MPTRFASLHRSAALAGLLALAACGGGAENNISALDNELLANGADPALTSALEDQILVDPNLVQQAHPNSARPPETPVQAQYPTGGPQGAQARAQAANVGADLDYGPEWAQRLPTEFPLYPGGRLTEAAGSNRDSRRLRVVILAGLMPEEPEVLGLLALMEIQASRLPARTGPDGAFVPITEQSRARWDQLLIRRGLAALDRVEALGGVDGPYALQAALAACHARARKAEDTDWPRIAALYDRLRTVMPSAVVDLNRAVAYSMAFGPEAGLALVEEIAGDVALRNYAPLPAARGDFLFRAGRLAEARTQFEQAANLTRNAREKAFLLGRAAACG